MTLQRITTLFTLLAVLLLGVGRAIAPAQAAPPATAITFTGGELLGKPTDSSITINIVPDSTIEYYYEYGTSSGVYINETSPVTAPGGEPHEVVITGLSPNTRYYYRMVYDGDGDVDDGDFEVRDEHTFHTQRAEGEEFVFTVTSDSHGNFGTNTATNILNNGNGPDFHVDIGDTFMVDNGLAETQSAYNGRYAQWRGSGYFGGISQSVPVYLAMGNHEEEEGWNLDDSPSRAVLNIEARKLYFPMPTDGGFYTGNIDPLALLSDDQLRQDYYAWEWGDALFVVIDPFQYTMTLPYNPIAGEESDETIAGDQWNWTLGDQQYNWLKQTLTNSDAKYKFVFSHNMVGGVITSGVSGGPEYVRGGAGGAPYFEWGGYNADGSWGFGTKRPGWDKPIHQLFTENGVSAYFHGHDHQYVYETRDGVVYQEVPSPSMGGSGFGGIYAEGDYTDFYGDYSTIEILPNAGHLKISVAPTVATVDYIAASGGGINYSYDILPTEVTEPDFTITATAGPNGSISPSGDVGVVAGDDQSFTITPDSNYQVDDVLVDGGSVGAVTGYTFSNVQADHTIEAIFVEAPPTGEVVVDGAVSSVTADGVGTFSINHTTGTGINRLMLVGLSINNYSTAPTIDAVTFNYDTTEMPFTPVGQIDYEGRHVAIYGLVDPPNGQTGTVDVDFAAAVGYGIVAGAANFAGVDQTTPWGTFASASDQSDTASVEVTGLAGNELVFDTVFMGAATIPTMTAGADQAELWNMSGNRAGGVASTEEASGSSVTMSWTTGGTSVYWAIGAVPINPASTTPPVEYTITASAGANGSISPSGAVSVTEGDDQSFTITPAGGYVVADVLVDGDSVGAVSNYTFSNVQADHTIEATFVEAPPTGEVTVDGAVSSVTGDDASSIDVAHTTGTGTNRLMLVGVSWNSYNDPRTIDSVTFTPDGGTAVDLTGVISRRYDDDNRYSAIYSLLNPPSGQAGTVTVDFSDSVDYGIVVGVVNFAGVDQTTPFGPTGGADASSDAPSVELTGLDGDELVFDTVFYGGANPVPALTADASQTEQWNDTIANTRGAASTEEAGGSSSVTMDWSTDTSSLWVGVAVAINPVSTEPIMPEHTILLGRPTNNSVTVNAILEQGGRASFEYGTSSGNYTTGQTAILAATAGEPVETVIGGLSANTQYYYRMLYRETGATEWIPGDEHSFHTQRDQDEPFTFTIISDSHLGDTFSGNDPARYEQTTLNVAADNPEFHLDLGDTFGMNDPTNQDEANAIYLEQRPYFGNFSHSAPVFLAIGNHENEEGWNLDDTPFSKALGSIIARKQYFLNPVTGGFYSGNDDPLPEIGGDELREDYYAWEWGDALFIVLDPFQYTMVKPYELDPFNEDETETGDQWEWTLGLEQFLWFKQTLENSDASYKFVFAHHMVGGMPNLSAGGADAGYVRLGAEAASYFEWGGLNADDTPGFNTERSGWGDDPIHQLMIDNGVTAFFHGHDHQFVHEERDGIVYQLVPSASMGSGDYGFDLYDDSPYAVSGGNLPNAGHLRVTVEQGQATVEYVRSAISGDTGVTNGEVSYSYTMAPTGGPSHTLTVDVDPSNAGATTPEVGTHSYVEGSVVTVTASPTSEYQFDHWEGACTGSDTCQVTMDADKSVTAHFVEAPEGAITYIGDIGEATAKTSGDTLVINTTAPVVTGDDIIIAYATDPNANVPPFTVTDTAGNTYSEVGFAVNTGQLRTYIFAAYDVNPLPAGSDITITASASVTARTAVVSVFRGLADEEPFDQTSTGSGSGATPSSGATATTTEADELLIGAIGTEGPDGDAVGTWVNLFTAGPRLGTTGDTADTNITVSLGYRMVSATGAYTAEKSGVTSRDWAAIIATFKAEPDPTAPRITISDTPLSAFSSLPGTPSVEQSYTVSGINLMDDITISAPSDFQISLTSDSGFESSLTLPQSGGIVDETTIYVRFNRATEGTSSGNIAHTSTDATTRNVAVSGTAAPLAPVAFSILLGRPTDHSVTANIIPDQDAEFYIEYGTASGVYSGETISDTVTADEPIEIVIDGLSANTEYFYRIVYRQTGTTEWNPGAEHSFQTQRAPGSTFTFTIISDSHLGQYGGQTEDELALYEQTLQNVAADQPDFHIDNGDTFAMDPSPLGAGMTEAEADAAYVIQRPDLDTISASAPVFLAIGNHENEEGWNWDDDFDLPEQSLAIVGLKARKKYFPNPIPDDFYTGNSDSLPAEFLAAYPDFLNEDNYHEDYYAWTWGDALFVVLDPLQYSMTWPNEDGSGYGGEGNDDEESGDRWDWTLGIDQYLWLKETLENSDATYKFVLSHHVTGGSTQYGRGGISAASLYEWGGYNADGTWEWDTERPASEGWTVPIHQLFVDNGVDAYIHGHDHIYAYEELDGIAYLEVPKPDDAGYDWEPYGYGYNEDLYPDAIEILPNSGHIRVTVSPSEATFEYVRSYLPGDGTNGQVAHSFTIPAGASTTYDLTMAVNPSEGGTTEPAEGVSTYAVDTTVAITATANAGYVFDGWTGDVADPNSASTTVTMDSDKTVTANFVELYDLTVTSVGNGGVALDPTGGTYPDGTIVEVTAVPDEGWQFDSWSGDLSSPTNPEMITMDGDKSVTAHFIEITNEAELTGTVTLQRADPAPNPSWSVPLTVGLYKVDQDQATLVYSFTPTTDNNGEFTISGIEPGEYEIAVKNSHTLQVVEIVTLDPGSNEYDFGTLLEGDADNSNNINIVDFSILSDSFGLSVGDPDYDSRADFNNNGTINIVDFSLLSDNFGLLGEKPSGQ